MDNQNESREVSEQDLLSIAREILRDYNPPIMEVIEFPNGYRFTIVRKLYNNEAKSNKI
jgi:hypothetical protein